MITNFKIFEQSSKFVRIFENWSKKRPTVGDYAICQDQSTLIIDELVNTFLNSHIGEIIYIKQGANYPYYVQYNNIPEELKPHFNLTDYPKCRVFSNQEILYHSKNKEELELILNTNKYNL